MMGGWLLTKEYKYHKIQLDQLTQATPFHVLLLYLEYSFYRPFYAAECFEENPH